MEKWITPTFAPNYMISNFGRIKNISRNKFIVGQKKGNYRRICLPPNHRFYVHRLVALLFLPNPNKLPFINHLNGIGYDNRVENLEWTNQKDNIYHSKKITKNGAVISSQKIKKLYKENETLSKNKFIKLLLDNCN